MKRIAQLLFPILLLGVPVGCGGTYAEDPKNFRRALSFSPPEGTRVEHSWYWYNRHFFGIFAEHEFYLEVSGKVDFIRDYNIKPEQMCSRSDVSQRAPSWYLPKAMASYECWTAPDFGGLRFYRDRQTGHVFIHDVAL